MNENRQLPKYSGADLESESCPNMSDLGKAVADLLGDWVRGIYHLSTKGVDWTDSWCIEISIKTTLSTFDFDELTRLVLLCHQRAIRCQISANKSSLELMFHRRKKSHPGLQMHEWHPNIFEAIKRFEKEYGPC